jgi:hypothetical protein
MYDKSWRGQFPLSGFRLLVWLAIDKGGGEAGFATVATAPSVPEHLGIPILETAGQGGS